ncbi:MAG: PepSY domain-containing protein [Reinekea sp.]|jgi:hypothetical protein
MALFRLPLILLITVITTCAVADDDCHEPIEQWQSRQVLKDMLLQHGWQVRHIKVREHCYVADGLDAHQRRTRVWLAPASLSVQRIMIDFEPGIALERIWNLGEENQTQGDTLHPNPLLELENNHD